MGFGPLAGVSLKEAKAKAIKFDGVRSDGHDPLEVRRQEQGKQRTNEITAAGVWTFKQATEAYLKGHAHTWKHARAKALWHNPVVRYAYPVIGNLPLNEIKIGHITTIMDRTVEAGALKVGPRVRACIEQVFNAAIAHGMRDANLGNPADGKKIRAIRSEVKTEKKHFRRIEGADTVEGLVKVPAMFQHLYEKALLSKQEGQEMPGSTALSAFLFMIATAARPTEAVEAEWNEVDLVKRIWVVPGKRMKGAREHIVPLSSLAMEVLDRQAKVRTSNMIFPGRGGNAISYPTFAGAARALTFDVGSPHSWRGVFRDWAGEIGNVARDTAEAALAHVLPKVEGSYKQLTLVEHRRVAMTRYAEWLIGKQGKVADFPATAAA
jgi:integrase